MHFNRSRVAHQQGSAEVLHARVERGLERDLRSDPGGITRCNGDARQGHGDWLPSSARLPIMALNNRKNIAKS
jgi:hypothetical protein